MLLFVNYAILSRLTRGLHLRYDRQQALHLFLEDLNLYDLEIR